VDGPSARNWANVWATLCANVCPIIASRLPYVKRLTPASRAIAFSARSPRPRGRLGPDRASVAVAHYKGAQIPHRLASCVVHDPAWDAPGTVAWSVLDRKRPNAIALHQPAMRDGCDDCSSETQVPCLPWLGKTEKIGLFCAVFACFCSEIGRFWACERQPRDGVDPFRRSVAAPMRDTEAGQSPRSKVYSHQTRT